MFAYKDMSVAAFEAVKKASGDFETEESRQSLEKDLILLAVFGLEDEERGETKKVVNEFKKAKCNTRIVSGDHKDCVLKLAAHFNLYSESNDSDFAKVNDLKKAISGAEFQSKVSTLLTNEEIIRDPQTDRVSLSFSSKKNETLFLEFVEKVHIIYRANPTCR
jgi:magnesium-transporting ATPase (P-type)